MYLRLFALLRLFFLNGCRGKINYLNCIIKRNICEEAVVFRVVLFLFVVGCAGVRKKLWLVSLVLDTKHCLLLLLKVLCGVCPAL